MLKCHSACVIGQTEANTTERFRGFFFLPKTEEGWKELTLGFNRLLLIHWAETYFGHPCLLVRGSSRVGFDLAAVGWGCLTWLPAFGSHSWYWHLWAFFEGARFIAWRLRCLVFREMPTGSRHFWNLWGGVTVLRLVSTIKMALCCTRAYVGHLTNNKY